MLHVEVQGQALKGSVKQLSGWIHPPNSILEMIAMLYQRQARQILPPVRLLDEGDLT